MTPTELRSRLKKLSQRLNRVQSQLNELHAHVEHLCDRRAIDYTVTDLAWAAVNCGVMADHALDLKLEDQMGFGGDASAPYARICAACGRSLPTVRRKGFQHYASILCRMFVRVNRKADIEALSALPDGVIHVDAFRATAEHDVAGAITLRVVDELSAWLRIACEHDGIDHSALMAADLWISIAATSAAAADKRIVCLNLAARSILRTDDQEYVAIAGDTQRWHQLDVGLGKA